MRWAFVDTSALLPLLDADDRDHARVVAALEEVARRRLRLVTSSYTLVEAAALVRSRLGMDAFRALGEVVDRAVEVLWVDGELHRRAWLRAALAGRRGPSLVDCVGFLVVEDHGLELVVAVDTHFAELGVAVLP